MSPSEKPIRAGEAALRETVRLACDHLRAGDRAAAARVLAPWASYLFPEIRDDPEVQRAQTEYREALAEVAREITEGLAVADSELLSLGLPPPGLDLDKFEELARIIEQDPGPLTLAKLHDMARAWAKRKQIEAKYRAEAEAVVLQRQTKEASAKEDRAEYLRRLKAAQGETTVSIMVIAQDQTRSADERMREIYRLDGRALAWTSQRWAELLGVTDSAVRQTDWWKKDRKRLCGED